MVLQWDSPWLQRSAVDSGDAEQLVDHAVGQQHLGFFSAGPEDLSRTFSEKVVQKGSLTDARGAPDDNHSRMPRPRLLELET
jgi:hypothetical protein